MPPVPLPSVDDALVRAEEALASGERFIAFFGPSSCGKTTALDRLAKKHGAPIREAAHDDLVFPPILPRTARSKPAFAKEGEAVVSFTPGRLASFRRGLSRFRVKLAKGFGWREATATE